MAKTPAKQPLDPSSAEREHRFHMAVVSTIQLLIAKGTPVAITFFICCAVVLTARAFAGKTTFADIMFRAIADFHGLKGLGFLSTTGFGGGGIVYGVMQRRLRLDVDKRNKGRRATQLSFDPSKFLGKDKDDES
jgi:hypothetical protein